MIRALIVDDERRARAYLAKLVASHADVEVVGEARDGVNALVEIERLKPDLVFLDVQMPELNGIEVARKLAENPGPLLVFTTAYDRFAIDAFELSATDYLLKPYDAERLARALDRVRTFLKGAGADVAPAIEDRLTRLLRALEGKTDESHDVDDASAAQPPLVRLPVQGRNGIVLLDLGEVYQIASTDRLVFAHTKDAQFMINFSIKDLEGRLPHETFFRTHRSCLVNLSHVREVIPWFHGKLMLKLDNGAEVPVSEERAPRLRVVLGLSAS